MYRATPLELILLSKVLTTSMKYTLASSLNGVRWYDPANPNLSHYIVWGSNSVERLQLQMGCHIWTPLKLVPPKQIFRTPSENLFPHHCIIYGSHYKGQRHEGKSVHVSAPEGTTVESTHDCQSKMLVPLLATGWLKIVATRNAECSSKTRVR